VEKKRKPTNGGSFIHLQITSCVNLTSPQAHRVGKLRLQRGCGTGAKELGKETAMSGLQRSQEGLKLALNSFLN